MVLDVFYINKTLIQEQTGCILTNIIYSNSIWGTFSTWNEHEFSDTL